MTLFDHVGLSVGDLDAQSAWYVAALGLRPERPGGIPELGVRVVFLVDPDHGWAIELLEHKDSLPGATSTDPAAALRTRGWGHLCLRITGLDAAYEKLLEAGAVSRMPPGPAPEPGVRIAFVTDPEDNLIELMDRTGATGDVSA